MKRVETCHAKYSLPCLPCNWIPCITIAISGQQSSCHVAKVLMAAELQYRAMDVGYAVSYPHYTQKSEEEGSQVSVVVLGVRAVEGLNLSSPESMVVCESEKRSASDWHAYSAKSQIVDVCFLF